MVPGDGEETVRKILVVDDSEDVRQFMLHLLVDCGYEVVAVPSARRAGEELGSAGFDLIILDLMLPDAHGFELIRAIRAADEEAKIIVVSGYAGCLEQRRLTEMGVKRVLTKPFKTTTLLETAHKLTGRQQELRKLWAEIGAESTESDSIYLSS